MYDKAVRRDDRRPCAAANNLDAIDVALRNLGVIPPRRFGIGRDVVCGTAFRLSVREVLDDLNAGQAQLQRLCELVRAGVPVNLSVEEFGREAEAIRAWQCFCEAVRDALSGQALSTRQLGLCIHSHQLPLEAYRLVADAVLGQGPRFVYLDNLQMSGRCNPEAGARAEASWSFLWRQRASVRPVMPTYGGIVRSACPLLADEVAATIVPGMGLAAPARSAWLPITLPLIVFATASGKMRWAMLTAAIGKALSLAEQIYAEARWPDERQEQDARDNRRLAVMITGLGDLVQRRGDDPASLSCLRWLADVVARIRAELHTQSRKIATRNGPIPALEQANHVGQWQAGPQRESWRRHWDDAVRQSALRHRNLLVISPYSVVPSGTASIAAYSDLLPVIACADAWSFAAPPEFCGWDATQFRNFHRRARATIQGSHIASFVAAGV